MTQINAGEPTADEHVMERGDLFRAAHALVKSLTWDEAFSVYDVLQVARFLEEGESE